MTEKDQELRRVYDGENLREVAEKLVTVDKTLDDIGASTSQFPEDRQEALKKLEKYSEVDFRSVEGEEIPENFDGGDLLEREIGGVYGVVNFVEPVYDENGRILEAEPSLGVLAEDETGYGFWSPDIHQIEFSQASERLPDESNIRYIGRKENVSFVADPFDCGKLVMLVKTSVDSDEGNAVTEFIDRRMRDELEDVQGVDPNRYTGGSYEIEISLEGQPEDIIQRIKSTYSSAIESIYGGEIE